jgi:hypothetical protein
MPGIDRLSKEFDEHISAVNSLDARPAPQMRSGQSQSFAHVNGLKEIH